MPCQMVSYAVISTNVVLISFPFPGHGIDLFIVPGVAFTRSGNRLGHGMGYYDKYLTQHAEKYAHKKTTIMALALNEQIVDVEDLPMDDHDVRLNYVVTENS